MQFGGRQAERQDQSRQQGVDQRQKDGNRFHDSTSFKLIPA
jgi:hypothetical protein